MKQKEGEKTRKAKAERKKENEKKGKKEKKAKRKKKIEKKRNEAKVSRLKIDASAGGTWRRKKRGLRRCRSSGSTRNNPLEPDQ